MRTVLCSCPTEPDKQNTITSPWELCRLLKLRAEQWNPSLPSERAASLWATNVPLTGVTLKDSIPSSPWGVTRWSASCKLRSLYSLAAKGTAAYRAPAANSIQNVRAKARTERATVSLGTASSGRYSQEGDPTHALLQRDTESRLTLQSLQLAASWKSADGAAPDRPCSKAWQASVFPGRTERPKLQSSTRETQRPPASQVKSLKSPPREFSIREDPPCFTRIPYHLLLSLLSVIFMILIIYRRSGQSLSRARAQGKEVWVLPGARAQLLRRTLTASTLNDCLSRQQRRVFRGSL